MPETYEEYVKRKKKAGITYMLTRQAWERYYSWPMVAQRAGLKPGFITRAIQERAEARRKLGR